MTAESIINVVVCDDHVVFTQGLCAVLLREPDINIVGVATRVSELIELVERTAPDVVVIDYELPDGTGASAARSLKLAHDAVQVVMLTAFATDQVLMEAIDSGCSGFVTKHSAATVLAGAIRQAAEGEIVVSAPLLRKVLPDLKRTRRGLGADLTARELEILRLLAAGASGRAIASRLYLSANTVRNHAQKILDKLGAHSRLEAVAVAIQEGIIERGSGQADDDRGDGHQEKYHIQDGR